MKKFAQAAIDLQIKKLAENIRMGSSSGPRDDLENNEDVPYDDIHEENEDKTENRYAGRSISDIADENISIDIPGSGDLGASKQLYKCEECEASYKYKGGLREHTRSKHEGIYYSCKYCRYKASYKSDLKKHLSAHIISVANVIMLSHG